MKTAREVAKMVNVVRGGDIFDQMEGIIRAYGEEVRDVCVKEVEMTAGINSMPFASAIRNLELP